MENPETTLDELMSEDPLNMTKSHIDAIIAYHRNARAKSLEKARAPRGKAARAAMSEVDRPKIDLASLGLLKPKAPAVVVKRRV